MTTPTPTSNGTSIWKIVGVIALVVIALAVIWPLLKGLFWIAVVALAAYGAYMLFRAKGRSTGGDTRPTPY